MTQSRRRSSFKSLVAERLEQRFVFDGSASPVGWGMENESMSLHADSALVSQLDSLIAPRLTPIWANNHEGFATEFQIELDGFPVAQELRYDKLFLVLNLPGGIGRVDAFDVSDVLSPQRVSSVKIPSIINAAEFFENILVLQTLDQSELPEMAPEVIVMESADANEPSQLGEDEMLWTDAFHGFFPLPTIQVLELDHLMNGVVASHSFAVPIENVFVLDNELFAITSDAYAPIAIDVSEEMSGDELDGSPQRPIFRQTLQTHLERFKLDTRSGTLTYVESFSFDGMIMATDTWQSDTTEGLALLVQSLTDMPYASNGRVSIQGFTLTEDGEIAYRRIPVTLPWGDSWVSSFEFQDGRGVLGSPQGLTTVDAKETGPVVVTSLIYENQFSTWAHLDDQLVLRIANDIDSDDESIAGQIVTIEVLDVSDLARPKRIVSRNFGDSDKPDTDWTWSVFENHVLKQSEGKYLLVTPTNSMSTGPVIAVPHEEDDSLPLESIILQWIPESNVQLISIAVLPATAVSTAIIELAGEFKIVGSITEAHLNEELLIALGYNEWVVINLSEEPLSPIRIDLQDPALMTGDSSVVDDMDSFSNTMARNLANPTDANSDGHTNQFDVLILINELNLRGSYALANSSEVNRTMLPDVNGDQWLTPLDVLVVINWINRTSDTRFQFEAEATPIAPILPAFASVTESTKRTSEQTSLLDDSFASLSVDWDLLDEELGSAEHTFSTPLTRFATRRHSLAK